MGKPFTPGSPEGGPGFVKMIPGKPLIPERYYSPSRSGLKFNVQSGPNTADFSLTD
jgi:hypothetical protein